MPPKISGIVELLVTDETSERFLSAVNSAVSDEVAVPRESFVADAALMHLVEVNLSVFRQVMAAQETFSAVGTPESVIDRLRESVSWV